MNDHRSHGGRCRRKGGGIWSRPQVGFGASAFGGPANGSDREPRSVRRSGGSSRVRRGPIRVRRADQVSTRIAFTLCGGAASPDLVTNCPALPNSEPSRSADFDAEPYGGLSYMSA